MSELPRYVCRRTTEPVTVDGRLTEKVWSQVDPVGIFRLADGSGEPDCLGYTLSAYPIGGQSPWIYKPINPCYT